MTGWVRLGAEAAGAVLSGLRPRPRGDETEMTACLAATFGIQPEDVEVSVVIVGAADGQVHAGGNSPGLRGTASLIGSALAELAGDGDEEDGDLCHTRYWHGGPAGNAGYVGISADKAGLS